ncbi:SRPBCC family protein [Jiangella gansuensis]|uniref:SRPBCC family protein n=1 Tax=Jiangella gansuensis TaxID=281473 RepID=UPI00047A8E45|nr:SRPBCC family protein [Jiangella gansuensis]
MKIDNEFTVGAPVGQAWTVLTDLEGIAPCLPGAQLTGVDGDVHSGRIKVKVGPIVAEYAGTARFVHRDEDQHRAIIRATGRDARGAGAASAEIVAQLREGGAGTVVSVDTDLRISGRIAQLGRGMISEVSTKLLAQFVECLEAKLNTPVGAAAATGSLAGGTSAAAAAAGAATLASGVAVEEPQRDPASPGRPSPEPEPEEPHPDPASPGRPSPEPEPEEPHPDPASPGRPSPEPEPEEPHPDPASPGPPSAEAATPAAAAPAAAAPAAAAPAAAAFGRPETRPADPTTPDGEALDLMSVAGGSIAKRLVPLVLVIVVVIALIVYLVVR